MIMLNPASPSDPKLWGSIQVTAMYDMSAATGGKRMGPSSQRNYPRNGLNDGGVIYWQQNQWTSEFFTRTRKCWMNQTSLYKGHSLVLRNGKVDRSFSWRPYRMGFRRDSALAAINWNMSKGTSGSDLTMPAWHSLGVAEDGGEAEDKGDEESGGCRLTYNHKQKTLDAILCRGWQGALPSMTNPGCASGNSFSYLNALYKANQAREPALNTGYEGNL